MSERLRERLNGAQIDRQFDSISQGGRIRTTPTPSPRSSRSLGSYVDEEHPTSATQSAAPDFSASSKVGFVQGNETSEDISVTPTPKSPLETSSEVITKPKENRRVPTARPPPILKKLSSGSERPPESSSILSPTSQGSWSTATTGNQGTIALGDNPTSPESGVPITGKTTRKSATTRFNEEVAVSIPKASTVSRSSGSRLFSEGSQRPGRKHPIVVASTGAGKRRPAVMRQRSSQVASFGASKDSPEISSSPNLAPSSKSTDAEPVESPGGEVEVFSPMGTRAASPSSSKHRQALSSTNLLSTAGARAGVVEDPSSEAVGVQKPSTSSEISEPLVDSDFRSQSVDKTHLSNRSSSNLASLTSKSSAAVPTTAPFQAYGILETGQSPIDLGKNRGKEAFKNEIVPLKAPASAGPELSAKVSQPIPRTKSQLTLLLERQKSQSTGQED